jgi:ketosteroid isomerase-like protein
MRLRFVSISMALILAMSCVHSPVPPGDASDDLQQRQESFFTALSTKDSALVVAHFSDDAVLQIANMPPMRGRAAIERFYGNVFRFLSRSESVVEQTQLSASGDLAYSSGAQTNAFDREQGRVEYEGKFLLVWQKVNGEWLIRAYSLSNNQGER